MNSTYRWIIDSHSLPHNEMNRKSRKKLKSNQITKRVKQRKGYKGQPKKNRRFIEVEVTTGCYLYPPTLLPTQ